VNLLAQIDIGKKFDSPFGQTKTLGDLTSLVLKAGFVISGILILFFMIFAGFNIIAGAGNNDPKAAEQGKQAATSAALGFAIVFVAYWIVRLIEVLTGAHLIS
jgi:hypothetical protein